MAQETELAGLVVSGKYRLVRRLGESIPALYEARHPRLAGRFAVRLWAPTMPWDAFRRGAELAVTLRHPGVVQVIDFNCEPGAPPFLVCEWLEGTTLEELMAGSGLLPVPRVAALVESTAWALASAHQQGVVHQELHPREIHVVQAPGSTREWTKLDGFGVAAALARAGAIPPSPYRAPEQATPDEGGADPQSDQHALAAIAFEMLAGVRPFESPGEALQSPPLLSELAPGVTPAVDAVIRQALAADPEERFSGVLEFARGLREAAEGVSTQVVRRRKIEAAAAAKAAKARKEKVAEAPVSPFFNPVQAQLAEGFRPGRLLGWRGKMSRMIPPLPVGVPARVGLAMALLLGAFGVAWVALRRPTERVSAEPAAAAATVATAARVPAIAPIAHEPSAAAAVAEPAPAAGSTATPTAAVMTTRVEPLVQPIAERPAPEPPPPPVLAVKRAHSTRSARTPAATAPAAAATADAKAKAASAAGGACTMALTSRPWAHLWLDGKDTGRRTPVADLRVPCGDHKLVLKRDDLDIYQMEVITVRPGTTFRKSYPLK